MPTNSPPNYATGDAEVVVEVKEYSVQARAIRGHCVVEGKLYLSIFSIYGTFRLGGCSSSMC